MRTALYIDTLLSNKKIASKKLAKIVKHLFQNSDIIYTLILEKSLILAKKRVKNIVKPINYHKRDKFLRFIEKLFYNSYEVSIFKIEGKKLFINILVTVVTLFKLRQVEILRFYIIKILNSLNDKVVVLVFMKKLESLET